MMINEMPCNVKGLLFDYGGTIDTGGEHWSWVIWRAWQEAKVDASLQVFREAYVHGERELARTLHILPHHTFFDLLKIKIEIELQWLSQHAGFPSSDIAVKAHEIATLCNHVAHRHAKEAGSVLNDLSKRYPMVLVSNFYGNINTVLEDFGLRKYFKDIIESSVVGVRKPDPEIFILGVKALGFRPEECVVIGDSFKKDIEPALKAGCKAIWIKGPGWTEEEDRKEYSPTIKKLEELREILL